LSFHNEKYIDDLVEQIGPMDRVRVIRATPGEENFLNMVGQVVMVVDGDQYLVAFDNGSSASFGPEQLQPAG
jgi:hypothetical protein